MAKKCGKLCRRRSVASEGFLQVQSICPENTSEYHDDLLKRECVFLDVDTVVEVKTHCLTDITRHGTIHDMTFINMTQDKTTITDTDN